MRSERNGRTGVGRITVNAQIALEVHSPRDFFAPDSYGAFHRLRCRYWSGTVGRQLKFTLRDGAGCNGCGCFRGNCKDSQSGQRAGAERADRRQRPIQFPQHCAQSVSPYRDRERIRAVRARRQAEFHRTGDADDHAAGCGGLNHYYRA